MPPSEAPSSLDASSSNHAWSQPHHGVNQSFHPAASSFAASAANTAAALGSTLREASNVLHETNSQVMPCCLLPHALFEACICSMQINPHALIVLDLLVGMHCPAMDRKAACMRLSTQFCLLKCLLSTHTTCVNSQNGCLLSVGHVTLCLLHKLGGLCSLHQLHTKPS